MLPLISGLGIAQIISWGSLFYAIGVLGPAMRRDLGVSELYLFSAFTAGLFVSGALAPVMGALIDRRGGRLVLSLGSALAIVALLTLAFAPNEYVMVAGWLLAGAAMSGCLYDPAFATLSQHTGPRYRKAVTGLTLFGGFASTVFWPLSHLLLEAWGWRTTFGIYAAMHLCLCLPIHQLLVPKHSHLTQTEAKPKVDAAGAPGLADPRIVWLAGSFALATFIFGVIAVHLINLLTTAGLTPAQAVTISMLMGPMQVASRVIELGFSGRVRAVTFGLVTFGLMMLALLALINVEGFGIMSIAFVIAFGCGNGLLTIVRGSAPAELFGTQGLGAVLGYLSRAAFFAKAIAPASFSALLTFGFTRNAALSTLVALAIAGGATYAMAVRQKPVPQAAR